jgi:DNA-binding transcriptional ArsR family regulator
MSIKTVKSDLFEQFARIGMALSNAKRLQILEYLAQGQRNVETLARLTGLSIASTSQHLQHLRQAGLVSASKEGLYVFYRLAGDSIVRLLRANAGPENPPKSTVGQAYYDSKDDLNPCPREN